MKRKVVERIKSNSYFGGERVGWIMNFPLVDSSRVLVDLDEESSLDNVRYLIDLNSGEYKELYRNSTDFMGGDGWTN